MLGAKPRLSTARSEPRGIAQVTRGRRLARSGRRGLGFALDRAERGAGNMHATTHGSRARRGRRRQYEGIRARGRQASLGRSTPSVQARARASRMGCLGSLAASEPTTAGGLLGCGPDSCVCRAATVGGVAMRLVARAGARSGAKPVPQHHSRGAGEEDGHAGSNDPSPSSPVGACLTCQGCGAMPPADHA